MPLQIRWFLNNNGNFTSYGNSDFPNLPPTRDDWKFNSFIVNFSTKGFNFGILLLLSTFPRSSSAISVKNSTTWIYIISTIFKNTTFQEAPRRICWFFLNFGNTITNAMYAITTDVFLTNTISESLQKLIDSISYFFNIGFTSGHNFTNKWDTHNSHLDNIFTFFDVPIFDFGTSKFESWYWTPNTSRIYSNHMLPTRHPRTFEF